MAETVINSCWLGYFFSCWHLWIPRQTLPQGIKHDDDLRIVKLDLHAKMGEYSYLAKRRRGIKSLLLDELVEVALAMKVNLCWCKSIQHTKRLRRRYRCPSAQQSTRTGGKQPQCSGWWKIRKETFKSCHYSGDDPVDRSLSEWKEWRLFLSLQDWFGGMEERRRVALCEADALASITSWSSPSSATLRRKSGDEACLSKDTDMPVFDWQNKINREILQQLRQELMEARTLLVEVWRRGEVRK